MKIFFAAKTTISTTTITTTMVPTTFNSVATTNQTLLITDLMKSSIGTEFT